MAPTNQTNNPFSGFGQFGTGFPFNNNGQPAPPPNIFNNSSSYSYSGNAGTKNTKHNPSASSAKDRQNPRSDPRINVTHGPKMSGPVIHIKVGEPTTEYHISADMLCASSEFFRAVKNTSSTEAKTRTVYLKTDEPQIFDIYARWLATQKIATQTADDEFVRLIKAYILGEKLRDVAFKDTVADALVAKSRQKAKETKVKIVGGNITSYFGGKLTKTIDDYHKEFLFDLSKATLEHQAKSGGAPNPWDSLKECEFHEHALGEKNCYKSKLWQT